jgi:hypothetical protein
MVLVLFLIAVGVMEAILRRPRVAAPQKRTTGTLPDSTNAPANTEELLSLATALGPSVPTGGSPKIAGSQPETVEKSRPSRLD